MVLEELQLRENGEDIVMISSTAKADTAQERENKGDFSYDTEAVAATQAEIDADMEILKGYDDQYNDLLTQQTELEKQCTNFNYEDLSKIKSSKEANSLLKKVEGQIQQIKTLISTTQNAIKHWKRKKKKQMLK